MNKACILIHMVQVCFSVFPPFVGFSSVHISTRTAENRRKLSDGLRTYSMCVSLFITSIYHPIDVIFLCEVVHTDCSRLTMMWTLPTRRNDRILHKYCRQDTDQYVRWKGILVLNFSIGYVLYVDIVNLIITFWAKKTSTQNNVPSITSQTSD